MAPGEGILPLVEILRALDEIRYRGFYDVEIFSEDVWRSDYDVTLRKCRAFFDGRGEVRRRERCAEARRK
ncbi:MAG: hypothetical protein WAV18_16025 [Roseiarcus sp.]